MEGNTYLNDRLIKIQEYAKLIGKSKSSVFEHIANGKLPSGVHQGRGLFFSYREIQSYISWALSIEANHSDKYHEWLTSRELRFKDYKANIEGRADWRDYLSWLDLNKATFAHYAVVVRKAA